MTTFEVDLIRTVWPYAWTLILSAGAWFLRAQSSRLDGISDTLKKFGEELRRVEMEMVKDRSDHRHRIDKLIGDADSRISRIEAVCETHHVQVVNRRDTQTSRPIYWAHDSDISGNSTT